jgi:hypothetical protein
MVLRGDQHRQRHGAKRGHHRADRRDCQRFQRPQAVDVQIGGQRRPGFLRPGGKLGQSMMSAIGSTRASQTQKPKNAAASPTANISRKRGEV